MSTVDAPPNGAVAQEPGLYDWFARKVPEVRDELGRLDQQRRSLERSYQQEKERLAQVHKNRVARVEYEKRRLASLLKALGEDVPSRPSSRQTKARSRVYVSNPLILRVMDEIEKQGNDLFSVIGIRSRMTPKPAEPGVRYAFEYLREREYIARQGRENKPNGRTLYSRLPDADVVRNSLRTELENPRPTAPRRHSGVSPAQLQRTGRVLQELQRETGEPVSIRQMGNQLGIPANSDGRLRNAVLALVKDGCVEQVGVRKENPGGQPSKVFRITKPDRLIEVIGANHG